MYGATTMSKYDKDAQHWVRREIEGQTDNDTWCDLGLIVAAYAFICVYVMFLDSLADWAVGL